MSVWVEDEWEQRCPTPWSQIFARLFSAAGRHLDLRYGIANVQFDQPFRKAQRH
jgi:hypothetical protein